ncbi:hypothetical protein ACGFX4_32685 [Kitasatospora sp. NPDC048365]|uniref:hypothetical protein n=1 Tax=Kitasatospora sp. NPDC048365 TaxID=3364050 RepID=UPI003724900D
MSVRLAHQGGWDEITAAVLGPLLVIAALVAAAVRRRPLDDDWDEDEEDLPEDG